jgi:hypothetical protein
MFGRQLQPVGPTIFVPASPRLGVFSSFIAQVLAKAQGVPLAVTLHLVPFLPNAATVQTAPVNVPHLWKTGTDADAPPIPADIATTATMVMHKSDLDLVMLPPVRRRYFQTPYCFPLRSMPETPEPVEEHRFVDSG